MMADPLRWLMVHLSVCVGATALQATDVSAQSAEPDGKTYTLRYRFVDGDSVYYEDHQHVAMTLRHGGSERTDVNDVTEQKHFRVKSVNAAGTAEIETGFDHVKMTAKFGESEPVSFDSSNPPDEIPRPFRSVAETVRKPHATLRVHATGKLAVEDPTAANPLNNFLVAFPDEPVAIGGTWKDQLVVPVSVNKELQRKITLLRTFRLKSVKDGVAEIGLATSIVNPVKSPQLRAQLIQRTPSGTIRFDMNRGQIVSRLIKGDETVLNPFGAGTFMRCKYQVTGKLITRDQVVAQADK